MTAPARGGSSVREIALALEIAQQRAAAEYPSRVHQSSYRIAGHVVTLRLVGTELGRLLPPAFSHLRLNGHSPEAELVIEAWDVAETGIAAPAPHPAIEEGSPGVIHTTEDGHCVVLQRNPTLFAFDRVRRRIVGAITDAKRLTQYDLGRPWHSELLLWQRDRGFQPVHAGFIQRDGHGILLGGPGGAGKSTTALTCMAAGWEYLADDYVALRANGAGFTGYGMYCSAHLEPNHLRRFAGLQANAIPGTRAWEDKSLLLLSGVAGSRLAAQAEIRVLALPRVVERPDSAFRRASKPEALLRIAPSSLILLPYQGLGHDGFKALVALVERVPAYWLELGSELDQLPGTVTAMLEDALRQ